MTLRVWQADTIVRQLITTATAYPFAHIIFELSALTSPPPSPSRELSSSTSSPLRGAGLGLGLVGESELACGHFAHGDLVRRLVEPRPER